MEKYILVEDSSKSKFGGGQKVTLDFIEVLKNNKKDFFIFDHGRGSKNEFKNRVINQGVQLFELSSYGKIRNIPVSSYSLSFLEIIFYPIFLLINFFQAKYYLNKNRITNYRLIYYSATKKALLLSVVLAKSNDKIIFHAHNLNRNNFFSRIFRKALEVFRVHVIAVSNSVALTYNLNRTTVVYNGVKQFSGELNKKLQNPINVAFIGSIIQWKGVDVFLESLNFLPKDFNYYVIGSGNKLSKLYSIWSKDNRVKFIGFVDNIDYYLKEKIDILCLPSLDGEACPMSILEALSFGIPVITTNIGGQAEIIDNTCGVLVNVSAPIEIADAAMKIKNDYAKYSDNARKRFDLFSFNSFEKSISKFINDI